ncbi:hypothetical protein LAZ67_7003550, partial [Cordylochernes scorpioides]
MAQIQTPETFDFSTPNEWPKWRKRFERYLVVSGMKKKEEADKIDLFMYLMGDRADDIFRTFKFEKEEEATKIDSVLKAFDSHFCVRKNIIYERAKFNSRIQEDREPVDEFITSLYKLADSCEFEGLHEQLIRDRIVVGVRDKALSERMQLDSELTLEKAVKMVRQQEAVRQQQVDLQRPSTSQKVNQVKFNSKKQSPKQQQQPSRKKEKSAKTRSRCPKCGGFTHREGQACRAEGQRCNLCSKTGHFANCCPDKQAKTAEVKAVSELDEEIGFLLEVSAVEDSSNLDDDEGECRRRWTAEIQVNGKQVKFKLDSQADVTCVPLCLFKKIMGQQRLVESDINLRAAEFSELQTVGMFISTLRNGNYEIKEKIYVIRRLSEPLLSRRACELLNLARRIEVVATRINPIKEFPEVFEGLGQIGNPYEIKLKPGAKPYAVHTPRRVPIPLMEKLKTRLEELEKAGIIAQVNVATEWCAPTVIAGKPNGDIRLCVDLSRLNEHVQREVHPMPVVEHMLGQLGEARFFSKLDANSGFHQIPLSPDCQHLTTFITPFGRYKYCRMPFGISLAPEYFQRVMSIILQGMDGVMCYLDDILIFASDSKTHDRILRLVLRKLKEAKVTLNKAKCVFGVPRINFLGHILDEDGIRPDPAKIEAVAGMPAPTDVHGVRRFLGMVNHLGRKLRTTLPIAPENLNPKLVDSQALKRKEGRRRKDMKSRYDRRCGATDMEELSEGDTVWITDMRTWGIVKKKASTPRSYMVDTPVGTLRRNRFHLRKGYAVQYPADPSTPTFSGEELAENEKTPVVDYPSNDSEDGQIRTRTTQKDGESIDSFITELKGLSTSCEFESQKDSLIRDRIVYGIQDKALQERLLREPNLTLLKAIEMCKTDEISKQQIKIMQNNQNICQIRKYEKKHSPKQNQESEKEFKCQRCGKSHRAKNCPAWGKRCSKCKKMNHFAAFCKSSAIRSLNDETEETVWSIHEAKVVHTLEWKKSIIVNGKEICFKLDSGAEVNVLPYTFTRQMKGGGKQFTSQLFKDLTTLCGIKLRHSTAYHPQCNGKIERLHRTIKTAIRAHNSIKWTETLPTVLLGLRAVCAINKDNNHSLSQMVYGKTIRLPGEFFDDSKHHLHAEEFVQQLQKQMELLKPLNEKHHSKTKVFVHKDLKTCSHVFIRTDRVKKPLEPPYEGPFPVLERTDKYFTLKVKGKNVTTSIDRLRPAYLLADSDNITAEHPTATRPIVSGALPSTSSQQNPDPPDVEKYTEFQGTGSAPDLTRTRSGRIIKKP